MPAGLPQPILQRALITQMSVILSVWTPTNHIRKAFLSGDDNFEVGGIPLDPACWKFCRITPIAWSAERHKWVGNIVLADGSVQMANNPDC